MSYSCQCLTFNTLSSCIPQYLYYSGIWQGLQKILTDCSILLLPVYSVAYSSVGLWIGIIAVVKILISGNIKSFQQKFVTIHYRGFITCTLLSQVISFSSACLTREKMIQKLLVLICILYILTYENFILTCFSRI